MNWLIKASQLYRRMKNPEFFIIGGQVQIFDGWHDSWLGQAISSLPGDISYPLKFALPRGRVHPSKIPLIDASPECYGQRVQILQAFDINQAMWDFHNKHYTVNIPFAQQEFDKYFSSREETYLREYPEY